MFKDPVADGNGGLILRRIKSPDYAPGASGWSINRDGTAEFNDVLIRGTVESPNYVPGVSGWIVRDDGTAEFNDAEFRGGAESPNFVAGVSGWQVSDTGSAEFNDAIIRGTVTVVGASEGLFCYTGVPAAGNLAAALSGSPNGTFDSDPYGNPYNSGLVLYGVDENNGARIVFGDGGGRIWNIAEINVESATSLMNLQSAGAGTNPGVIRLRAASNALIVRDLLWNGDTGLTIDAGHPGFVSDTDATFSQAAVVSTATTLVTAKTNKKYKSTYGNEWAGATYTAPVDGFYDVTMVTDNSFVAGVNIRAVIRVNGTLLVSNSATGTIPAFVTYSGLYLDAGDVLTFLVRQDSGANQTVTGRISVHRRLT